MSWSSLVEDKLGAARRSVLRRVSASAPLGLLVRGMLALCAGAAAFVLCFALLTALMAYVRRRQREQADTFEDE